MTRKQRLLIVDDERLNRQLLSALFLSEYDVILAKNGAQALASALEMPQPDLILLDIKMPDMDGYEVLRQLRFDERTSNILVIFVTGLNQDVDEARGLEMGAVDYISKPFRTGVIRARVRNHMNYAWLLKELELKAFIDGLTGIPNRRQFDQIADIEWKRANRHGKPLSLIMVDVDYFKLYNDNYGHGAGDYVLQQIAKTMSQEVSRAGELVARYGGEEFVILLPETTYQEAIQIAERIRYAIESLRLQHEYSITASYITISMGGISLRPPLKATIAEILTIADKQLYIAKDAGRNQLSWDHETYYLPAV